MNALTDLPWLSAAHRLLQARWGDAVEPGAPMVIRRGPRHAVYRCPVDGAYPSSIVCKLSTTEESRCFSDWASLAFLTTVAPESRLAPAFLGGDADAGLFLMEDLGPSLSLDDRLRSTDEAACYADLEALATTMANLHAATVGHEADFAAIRQTLPQPPGLGRHREAVRWWSARDRVEAWFDATGIDLPTDFFPAMRLVAQSYAEPGAFLTFTHGDMAPTNNHVGPQGLRLLDFEYGAYRHALYDLTAWHVLCPLPEPIVSALCGTYRNTLARTWPVFEDDETFADAFAQMSAYRALGMLGWIEAGIIETDRPWVDDWSCRAAVLAATARLAAVCEGAASLSSLALGVGRLHQALQQRWPEIADPLPPWPVFQVSS